MPALSTTAITLVIAGVALSPLLVLHPEHLADPNSLLLTGWIGLVGTAAAYAAFVYGLRSATSPTAGTLSLAEPLLAAILGILVLREHLTTSGLLGCGILIAGLVAIAVIDVGRPSREPDSEE